MNKGALILWMTRFFIHLLLRLGKKIKDPVKVYGIFNKYLKFINVFLFLPKGFSIQKSILGGTPIEIVCSMKETPQTIVFYVHGGAFLMGLNNIYRKFACFLAHACKAKIILIDYNLLPLHPFPIALNQSLNAYKALLKTIDPAFIIIAGDSAGGNLALSTLLAAKEEAICMPAGCMVFSGWLDLTLQNLNDNNRKDRDPFITKCHLAKVAQAYIPHSIPKNNLLVSPIYGNLKGLPPLFMQVGTKEILLNDTLLFAKKAQDNGINTHLEMNHGLFHVQPILFPKSQSSRMLIEKVAYFIKEVTKIKSKYSHSQLE